MTTHPTPDELMQIRQLPAVENRVETGPIAFGDDWPGVFIRGDNALLGFLPAVQLAAKVLGKAPAENSHEYFQLVIAQQELCGLEGLLASCSLVKA